MLTEGRSPNPEQYARTAGVLYRVLDRESAIRPQTVGILVAHLEIQAEKGNEGLFGRDRIHNLFRNAIANTSPLGRTDYSEALKVLLFSGLTRDQEISQEIGEEQSAMVTRAILSAVPTDPTPYSPWTKNK